MNKKNAPSLRIALCTAHPFPPQLIGGAQRSMQQMAQMLGSIGHEVCFVSGLVGSGSLALRAKLAFRLTRKNVLRTRIGGHDCYRSWFPFATAEEFLGQFRPDVAICFSGFPAKMASAFRELGLPTIIYFRNVEIDDLGGDPSGAADCFISNSQFTADFMRDRYSIQSEVIPPLIAPEKYRCEPGGNVTFINPQVQKGRDIVYRLIARFPRIPFLIVKAWHLDEGASRELAELERQATNLRVLEPTNDMQTVYSQTRILLAPSQWDEAWGRVATEAQFSGIPVLASNAGGLPEAVGPGGIVLPKCAPSEDWEEALSRMWYDEEIYAQLSAQALNYSKREAIQRESILHKIDRAIRNVRLNAQS